MNTHSYNNQPIGILDSGVGGFSIWREIVKQLPQESTVYIADSKYCPYGNRSKEEIYQLAKRLVWFLLDKKCKLIVVACNTVTVSCLDRLRQDFLHIPIVGTVPVVKTAAKRSKNKKIGILSTTQTAKSDYQKRLIEKFAGDCEVVNIGTDKLVPFVERGDLQSRFLNKVFKEVLQPFIPASIDTLVLGCSHFPFLKDQMQQILGPKVLILDSGEAIARQVEQVLTARKSLSLQSKPQHEFYTTGNIQQFKNFVQKTIDSKFTGIIQKVKL